MSDNRITFKPLCTFDFPLLLKWLEAAHVKEWLDNDITYTIECIEQKYNSYIDGYVIINGIQKPINAYIIYLDHTPIVYIQLYNAYDFYTSLHSVNLPKNLNQLIC